MGELFNGIRYGWFWRVSSRSNERARVYIDKVVCLETFKRRFIQTCEIKSGMIAAILLLYCCKNVGEKREDLCAV